MVTLNQSWLSQTFIKNADKLCLSVERLFVQKPKFGHFCFFLQPSPDFILFGHQTKSLFWHTAKISSLSYLDLPFLKLSCPTNLALFVCSCLFGIVFLHCEICHEILRLAQSQNKKTERRKISFVHISIWYIQRRYYSRTTQLQQWP